MSFCSSLIRGTLILTALFLIIAFVPELPPMMEFAPYSITPPRPLSGALSVNAKLNGAEQLFKGQLRNPEGFAIVNNTVYSGVYGGDIIKIRNGQYLPVAKVSHSCDGYWDEKKCGRLLGMAFDKHGMLYVADAYYGIYKVNVESGKVQHLIATDKPIEGKLAKITSSVAVAKDGALYWTVSSCDVHFDDLILAMLGGPTGRLFKYDPVKKTNTLLLDDLYFANGIVLSAKEDFILVIETNLGRILRYWLTGPKKGESEVFVDGLPGVPDNFRPNGKGGFFVSLILSRVSSMPLLSDVIAPYPLVRRFLARILYLLELPFELLHKSYPQFYTGIMMHVISNFEYLLPFLPMEVMVVELSEHGEIIGSLHSNDGRLFPVSGIVLDDKYFYFGSPTNDFIGRVKYEGN